MAQAGFTPIQLYFSTTAAAVPTSGNLANGELAINITDGKLYYKSNAGVVTLLAGATAGPAGGSNTQVQFNSSGALAGSANMTFNGTTLTVNDLTDSSLTAGRVTYAGTSGNLVDSANLAFDGTNLGLGGTTNTYGSQTTLTLSGSNVSRIDFRSNSVFTGTILSYQSITEGLRLSTVAGYPITFHPAATEAGRFTAAGNLLIATTTATSAPAPSGGYLLEVAKTQNAFTEVLVKNTDPNSAGQANYTAISDTVTTRFGSAGSGDAYQSSSSGFVSVDGAYPLTFRTNSTERVRITSAGLVGFGTASPATIIHAIATGGAIRMQDSAGTSKYIQMRSDVTNSYLEHIGGPGDALRINNQAAGAIEFYTSNTERGRFDAAGRLNINNTSATANLSRTYIFGADTDSNGLQVAMSTSSGGPATSRAILVNGGQPNNNSQYYGIQVSPTQSYVTSITGIDVTYSASYGTSYGMSVNLSKSLDAVTPGTGIYVNVISTGTTNNSTLLAGDFKLSNTGSASTAGQNVARFHNAATSGQTSLLTFGTEASYTERGNIYYDRANSTFAINSTGVLTLQTGSSERMRITSAGEVIVGSTAVVDSSKFQIFGAKTLSSGIPQQQLNIADTTAIAAGVGGGIAFSAQYLSGSYTTMGSIEGVRENATSGNYAGALVFRTRSNGSDNFERARINSSGVFLVGTTSDTNLPGSGTSNATGVAVGGNQVRACRGAYTFQIGVTDTGAGVILQQFFQAGNSVGQITVSNNNATAYQTSSDYRLKDNPQPMTGALEKVAALKPCTWTWKNTGDEGQGFIAHELQAVCPDAVSGEKDAVDEEGKPKYQGVDTSFLIATLTAAIQEQQAIIQSLKARLDAANL